MSTDFDQTQMLHKLPKARLVDRLPWLVERVRGRRVVHVGFADAGCFGMQASAGTWLHEHLGRSAAGLVGVDIDEAGVERARDRGYEAHVADCRDPDAVLALELAPADVVLAGEVIEHLDDPGSMLAGLHPLVAADGELVLTTPNAYGLYNVLASNAGFEINHPDHVVMFTYRTLSTLLRRHGWEVVEVATYVPAFKGIEGSGLRLRLLSVAARVAVLLETVIGRLWNPYAADGLIMVARPVAPASPPQ